MGDGSVKVAIRVRPFNNRERQEGAVLCIEMKGKMTKVYSPELTKEFFFDYSYWSHDGFIEDPDSGMMVPDGPSSIYSDQRKVFNDLGVGVLNNAFEGYHCCLFAYGQTGSGKSYSMVGYGKNKGIIPIACEEIFRRIEEVESKTLHCEVTASMLEIYNEQIQDLLKPPHERVKGGLKIREDPKAGVYVQDLSKTPCSNYDEISEVLDKGNSNRTVAATQMNATSSRAHTVLTICFTQIVYDETGRPFNRKVSNINLVDLAGSERASKTGASGDTLKEGSNINKSLSTLGRVITALAKKSSGSKEVVPYRESSLTRILQNALGGNSKTTMIAAISPATYNIEETISTLRYADQVKSIKNQAIVNETPQEKLIRELKEENEKLKAMLEGKMIPGSGAGSGEDVEQLKAEFERQIEELRRAKEEAEKTYQDRVKDSENKILSGLTPKVKALPSKRVLKTPHIANLNEDPLLSGHICHDFKEGLNVIGKKNINKPPDIIIEGLGIGIDHCTIERNDDSYRIIPSSDPNLKTVINGKTLTEPADLNNEDRIRFGNHNYFLFIDPEELSNNKYDWEYAMKEAHEEEVKLILGKQDEELKAKEDEMKRKLESELEESKKKFEEEKKQLEDLMNKKAPNDAAAKKALAEKERELIEHQRLMQEEMRKKEQMIKQHDENRLALEELKKHLTHAIHQINEANERAVLLGKNVMFQPELYREGGGIAKGLQNTKVRVNVAYPNVSEDFKIYWSVDKLDGRLIDMQDICNQIELVGDTNVDMDYDPFSDTVESFSNNFHLIGHAYMYLDSAYYLAAIEDDSMAIINDQGGIKGSLDVALTPSLDEGGLDEYESMKDMLGKEFTISVKINSGKNLPQAFCTNLFCQYTMGALNDEIFKTNPIPETTSDPKFNYFKYHKFVLTHDIAEEFASRALVISVYGDMTQEKKTKELSKIQENSNRSLTVLSGIKYRAGISISDADLLQDMSNINYANPESKILDNSNFLSSTVNTTKNSTSKKDPHLVNQVVLKEKEINAVEEEFKRKEREIEKDIQKRLREIEKREKLMAEGGEVAVRKSSCCVVF